MRVMGLDFGQKTIGVAVSDEMGWTAQPVTVIRRQGVKKDLAELNKLTDEFQVTEVVMGLPKNMNGSQGEMADKARDFGQKLAEALGLPVTYWDERLSTVAAERVLLEGDVSRRKRKQVIDKVAAAIILQAYLDSRPAAPLGGGAG